MGVVGAGGRSLPLGFGLAVAMVLGMGWAAYRTNQRVAASADWHGHSLQVNITLHAMLAALYEAQSHERGFLITGAEPTLAPYRAALATAHEEVGRLIRLTADNPAQTARAAQLKALLVEHQAGLEQIISLRRAAGLGAVAEWVASERHIRLKPIQELAARFEREEAALAVSRDAGLAANVRTGAVLSVAAALGSSVMLGLVFFLLRRELQARRRLSGELRRQAALLESIVNSQAEGLVVCDPEGVLVLVNPAAARILGPASPGTALAAWAGLGHLHPLAGEEALPLEALPLARALRGEPSDDQDLLVKAPGAPNPAYLSVSGRPLRDPAGAVSGAMMVFRDVTDRHLAAEALRLAKESAEQASALKGMFVANMSHELRTPLNGVVGMLDLLVDTTLSEEQRGFLRTARLAADALLTNINDVLDFSKLEAAKLHVESIGFSLRQCLEDTLAAHALAAHRKGLEITSELAADLPERVIGDPARLRQVLTNLVANAIKFTASGEVVVRVAVDPAPDEAPAVAGTESLRLQVTVADTGIGIPPEKQALVFQPFAQADGSTTRTFGGTGLGLTIAAQLVRLMGGRIWLESEPGRGTSFHFTVTLAVAAGWRAPEVAEPIEVRGLRVLVVDDSPSSRRTLEAMLASWGLHATSVSDAAAALVELHQAEVERRGYDLHVIDNDMPGLSGLELIRRLRARPQQALAPIISLLATTAPGAEARSREAGASATVPKPVRQSDLLSAILASLPRRGPTQPAPEQPAPALVTPPSPLDILLVEDNEFNQAVALHSLRRHGHQVTLARNGQEAVEMTARHRFDLVLMDVQMPVLDGLSATAAIRAREQQAPGEGGRLPILAMTARAMEGDPEACLAAGMDGYVAKPLRLAALWSEIARVLGNGARTTAPAAPEERPAEREPPLDVVALLAEAGGDRDLLRRLVEIFREQAGELSGELQAAVAAGDPQRVTEKAHALKSLVGHWRRGRVFTRAAELEALGRTAGKGGMPGVERVYHSFRNELAQLDQDLSGLLEQERALA